MGFPGVCGSFPVVCSFSRVLLLLLTLTGSATEREIGDGRIDRLRAGEGRLEVGWLVDVVASFELSVLERTLGIPVLLE